MKTEQQIGNYNVDLALWQSAAKAYRTYPNGGPRLMIHDGMVHNGYEVLGRFNDDTAAKSTLLAAGFKLVDDKAWKAAPANT